MAMDPTADVPFAPWPGRRDLVAEAAALASRIPPALAPLARLAFTYRWSWLDGGEELFECVDPHRWRLCGGNPVRLLEETSPAALAAATDDHRLVAGARRLEQLVVADVSRPAVTTLAPPDRPVAFLCAEFAVHRSLPIYSGGLGALAGDLLKQASDAALPMVGIGLMYRQGYFRQRVDVSGWQHEYWIDSDPQRLPAALVTGRDGSVLLVRVRIRQREVVAQVWRADVGRVPLYLLDTERPENAPADRFITAQLYVGDPTIRLAQYVLLGVGGVRALQAMGIHPVVVHLNEGHAALATLELARAEIGRGAALDDAIAAARARTVFTTHTPVAAGNDTFDAAELLTAVADLPARLGMAPDDLASLGRTYAGDPRVGVTQLGLRMARAANAVSRRHGEVARAMWQPLYPGTPAEQVPIRHVTNGVHLPTWVGAPMRALLDRHLGPGWAGSADPARWAGVADIPDDDLWAARTAQRARLVEFVRDRSVTDRLARGETLEYAEAAAQAFDPSVLTIGFARRLATYKRLYLLVQDVGRALRLLGHPHPVQVVFAGKAHPRDDEAKRVLQMLFAVKGAPGAGARVVYLHDHDLGVAAEYVAGCDVWLNLPRPPLEASGTSGMKSAINGGLQLSVLDGWWAEAYDGTNGWAISGEVDPDHGAQDGRHGAALYDLLEREVVPAFHDRDRDGRPAAWLARIRRSLLTIGPAFSAARMLDDYIAGPYTP